MEGSLRRTINAFTMTAHASEALDTMVLRFRIAGVPASLAPYLDTPTQPYHSTRVPPTLDAQELSTADYAEFLGALPEPTGFRTTTGRTYKAPKRDVTPHWENLNKQIRGAYASIDDRMRLFDKIKERQRHNRLEVRKHATRMARQAQKQKQANTTNPFINRSRVAEALILLGHAVLLNERVARLDADVEGSKREDAGESQNKLPHSSRRKGASVRAI